MLVDEYSITVIIPIVFLIGICMGSFVSMASYRLPLGKEMVFTSSYCTSCNATLRVPDLIPLLSWIWQKGKCRRCHAKISIRYPLIELCMGLCFVAIVAMYGINFQSLMLMLMATALAIMIVVDLEHYILPDSTQVAVLVTGLAYSIYSGRGVEDIFPAMLAGLGIGLALHYGYLWLRKKDALGFGDVKFLGVAGAWLPFSDFVPFLFLGGLIGIFTGLLWRVLGRGELFPFGPALAISLFINVMVPDILHRIVF